MSIEMLLEEIRTLSIPERKQLIGFIVDTLTEDVQESAPRKRSILEFEGVGKEIWQGVDTQAYLDQLRDEWDRQD